MHTLTNRGPDEYRISLANGCPKWLRTYFLDPATGEFYIPDGCIGMSRAEALLCTGFDGVGIVHQHGHVYVPASWARKQTDSAKHLRVIEFFEAAAKQPKSECPSHLRPGKE